MDYLSIVTFRLFVFFLCNDTATPEIYTYGHTLSLHDALPFYQRPDHPQRMVRRDPIPKPDVREQTRSEEHTSELQSLMRISYAVFCLKKKKLIRYQSSYIK